MRRSSLLLGATACSMALLLGIGRRAYAGFYAGVEGGATFFNNDYTRVVIRHFLRLGHIRITMSAGWQVPAPGMNFRWVSRWRRSLPSVKAISIELPTAQAYCSRGAMRHSYSIMTNAYTAGINATPFTPYIGGGVGESTVVLNNVRPAGASGNFGATMPSLVIRVSAESPMHCHSSGALPLNIVILLRCDQETSQT